MADDSKASTIQSPTAPGQSIDPLLIIIWHQWSRKWLVASGEWVAEFLKLIVVEIGRDRSRPIEVTGVRSKKLPALISLDMASYALIGHES